VTDLIQTFSGEAFVDDRGIVSFVNGLNLAKWKRFYFVENHKIGFVRAWHGHKFESKLIIPVNGIVQVSAVAIENWENPNKNLKPENHFLSSSKPVAMYIPGGYANGFKSLTENSKLLIFSSSSLDESIKDDYRFQWDYWNCWEENFR